VKLRILLTLCFIVVSLSIYAQEEEGKKNIKTEKVKKSKKNKQEKDAFAVPDSIGSESKYSTRIQRLIADPLTPSKAAFYSAIIPGLVKHTSEKHGRYLSFTQPWELLSIITI